MTTAQVSLADCTLLIKRGISPKYADQGVLVLNQRCIRDWRLSLDPARRNDLDLRGVGEEKYLRQWDVVVNSTGVGTLGRVAQIAEPFGEAATVDSHVTIVRPDTDTVDGRYFGYAMKAQQAQIEAMGEGATGQTELSRARLGAEIRVTIHDRKDQEGIAAVLAAYDELIENNLRRIEVLEEMAQRVYREWFVNFRFPRFDEATYKDSALGQIPVRWRVSTLGEESTVTMGQSPKSEFYNDEGEGLPFHQGVTNFGTHFPSHVKFCTVETRIAEPDDTLVSVRAPVGRINVADTRMVIGRGLSGIRSNNAIAGFHYRQLRNIFSEEDRMGGGTIYKAITKGDLLGIPWLVPDVDTQLEFDRAERPTYDLISNLTNQVEILRSTRDLLLPKLVSGEIDVSDLDIDTDWLVA